MYDFHPYFTNDGSVGLYNEDFNDIYHSATGALTEAYEKFIYPIDFYFLAKLDSIKVLDICYGIGYNSKSFLNFILNNFYSKKAYNEMIHSNNISNKLLLSIDKRDTDNILDTKQANNIEKIYSDNIFPKISITAVDSDKILTYLSPFIKTGEKHIKNANRNFEYKEIEKFLKNSNQKFYPKINNLVNFLILSKIFEQTSDFLTDSDVENILLNKKNYRYFTPELLGIYRYLKDKHGKTYKNDILFSFLHNIYYNHISKKYKNALKTYKLQDIDFNIVINDARNFLVNNCNKYNLIFLDAFTPSKCPCLWSYDFFLQLYSHLEPEGQILTYSSSAAVRSAMIEAGFYVGYIKNLQGDKIIGTIASNSKSQIKFPLSQYDLGLLKTRAGIFYRDKNLTALNEAIIGERNSELKMCKRISSSQYIKNNSRN